jgi:ATP-dependent Clp protease ATP-binding subunit ClpC
MFHIFTDRSRRVVQLANQAANQFKHSHIGSEHFLIGLIEEGSGVAFVVLSHFEVSTDKVRSEIESLTLPVQEEASTSHRPQDATTHEICNAASEEASAMGHHYIGTEHLLLGLLRLPDTSAAVILEKLGVPASSIREAINGIIRAGT